MKKHLKLYTFLSLFMLLLTACGSGETKSFMLYEDAEGGLNPQWIVKRGDTTPTRIVAHNNSQYAIHLPVSWYQDANGNWHNPHEYHLPLHNEQASYLEVDVGGTGEEVPHYVLGVIIKSSYGKRTLLWDSWYNHQGLKAHMSTNEDGSASMVFPSPIELVRGFGYESTTTWSHFSVNIIAYLQQFEPNNQLIEVETFVATGGDLDNILLAN